MIPQLSSVAARQGGVLTIQQARAGGLTGAAFSRAIREKKLIPVRRGVYAIGDIWAPASVREQHRMRVAAAIALRDGFGVEPPPVVGGFWSAAFVYSLPIRPRSVIERVPDPTKKVESSAERLILTKEPDAKYAPPVVDLISADRGRRSYRYGVDTRPALLPRNHVDLIEGVPLTNLARTAVDLMRAGSRIDALIVADAVLHGGLPKSELTAMAEFCALWPNGAQAVEMADFADALAESPAESLARLTVAGFDLPGPPPELQVEFHDPHGVFLARVDLFFRMARTILEVDGQIKYSDPWCGSEEEARRRERERQELLEAAGWIVIRTTWTELLTDPAALCRRLLAAFARSSGIAS